MYHIYHDVLINAPIDLVFVAISNPQKLVDWWPLKCTGEVQLNSEYNLFFTEEFNWYGKVDRLVQNRAFFIKMTRSDQDWNPTTFGFELEEMDGGVMLSFSHINWPVNNHHFRRSSYCWAILLQGLKGYLEEGKIIPFHKRA